MAAQTPARQHSTDCVSQLVVQLQLWQLWYLHDRPQRMACPLRQNRQGSRLHPQGLHHHRRAGASLLRAGLVAAQQVLQ